MYVYIGEVFFMKRTISGLLALILTVGLMLGAVLPAAAETNVAGDVNGDSRVNSLDTLIALRVLSGQSYTGKVQSRGLFVNGDALADTADVVTMLRNLSPNWEASLVAPDAEETVAYQPVNNTYYIESKAIRIVNQNILHGGGGNNPMNAKKPYRMNRMELLMEAYAPDICCLQEYRWSDWYTLFENTIFPCGSTDAEYEMYKACRVDLSLNDLPGAGSTPEQPLMIEECLAIFWNNARFDLCKDSSGNEAKGQFWFSETPDVPSPAYGSTIEDVTWSEENQCYYDGRQRQSAWVKLYDKQTGKEFYVINCHGINASDADAPVLCTFTMQTILNESKKILQKYGDAPVIVTGDFNVDYYNKSDALAIETIESEYTDVGVMFNDMQGTFPNWGRNIKDDGTIPVRGDIFYVKDPNRAVPVYHHVMQDTFDADYNIIPSGFGGINANWTTEADDRTNGYYVSDHFGVCADFVIN